MNKKRIVILGGSGFIGTNFISIYKKQYTIKILDIKKSSTFPEFYEYCDIRSLNQLRSSLKFGDILINLAAEHHDNIMPISRYYETNTQGAKNICQIAKEKEIKKIIFTSTVAVYGLDNSPKSEDTVTNPFNDYGKSKLDAEKHYIQWQKEYNTDLKIIRPTAIFGPTNRGNIYNLLNQIARNRFVMIGRGDNVKSIGYVDNISHMINASIINQNNEFELYNFADKPDLSTYELISIIREKLNKKPSRFFIPHTLAYIAGLWFDLFSKLCRKNFTISSIRIKKFCSPTTIYCNKKPNNYRQQVTIEDGISKTIKSEFF